MNIGYQDRYSCNLPRVADKRAPSRQRLPAIKKESSIALSKEGKTSFVITWSPTKNDIEKEMRKILLSCPRFRVLATVLAARP